jgi:putative FmdB family regulatory protein
MPIFDYKCKNCGTKYEGIVLKGEKLDKCPKCGSKKAQQQMPTSVKIKTSRKGSNPTTLDEAVAGLVVAIVNKVR